MSRYMKNQSCRWKGFCYNITISWNNEIPSSDRVILQILEAYYLQFNVWYALFKSMISVLQNEMVVVFLKISILRVKN